MSELLFPPAEPGSVGEMYVMHHAASPDCTRFDVFVMTVNGFACPRCGWELECGTDEEPH